MQIGGVKAPSPVGELGNVEMTQALLLADTQWEAIGSDLLMTGYLPASGGLQALERCLDQGIPTRPLAEVLDYSAAGPGSGSRDAGAQASTSGRSSEEDSHDFRRTPNSANSKVGIKALLRPFEQLLSTKFCLLPPVDFNSSIRTGRMRQWACLSVADHLWPRLKL